VFLDGPHLLLFDLHKHKGDDEPEEPNLNCVVFMYKEWLVKLNITANNIFDLFHVVLNNLPNSSKHVKHQ
jgi:hypothetical protein